MQSLMQISQIAWEESEKVGLRHFVSLCHKNVRRKCSYITRFNTVQGKHGCKVLRFGINYMGEISQNALTSIKAPTSAGHSQRP